MNECRYLSSNIKKRVHFDSRLCLSKLCPPEKIQAQINGSGVKSIESTLNFKLSSESFFLSNADHFISKLLENMIIPILIRFRKIASGYSGFSETKMIRFPVVSFENTNEFSKAIATSQLTIHHHKHLIPAAKRLHIFIALVFQNYSLKKLLRKKFDKLCKYILSCVHTLKFTLEFKSINSNRGHGKYDVSTIYLVNYKVSI